MDRPLDAEEPSDPTAGRWDRVAALFDRAADLEAGERAAFLDREAVGPDGAPDGALRREVERLLALEVGEGFLRGTAGPAAAVPEAGPWRLAEQVGCGGMGEVWRAERPLADGLRQTAAVKLVRPGFSDSVASRFRAERRILASLDHPSVARLLDGGTASDGRPYLATEFVDGDPITTWADAHRLGVDGRLALFIDVCEAVAYAHARLVVHRDLKPSNVLVAGTPEAPRVKLLDFGIAKLLDDDESDLTRTGRPVLTPAYAAPEQAAGGEVTTATDVYGLGVLLYELLTGTRPTGSQPPRPSDAVTTATSPDRSLTRETGDETAGTLRSTSTGRLGRRLRGDLDRITLKALRADPDRRYQGAAELAADVRRHLEGLPIEARPESVVYRVSKFVRRNRALVVAAMVALVAVVGAAVVSTVQSRRVLYEQRVNAAVSGYMQSLFRGVGGVDSTLTVAEVTARGARRVEGDLAGQPEAQAEAYRLIAEIYLSVGRFDAADSVAARSVDRWESVGRGRSAEAARSRTVWGLAAAGRGAPAEADRLFDRASSDLLDLGATRRDDVADTQTRLAMTLVERGRAAEAVPLLRHALDTRRTVHGDGSPEAETARGALEAGMQGGGMREEESPAGR